MKQAGLRGAEIQPVYPVAMDDPARGIRNLNYFSEEFLAVLRHAVREARRLELQLDFTLGSGWPYGGPFIPTSLAARRLRVLSQDVVGPKDYAWDLTPHLTGDDRIVRVVATPVGEDAVLDVARSRVLADQPKPEVSQGVRRGSFVRTRVEEGTWRLMVFLDSPTGQLVKRPTIGMEGPVLDHHSREAMALFLRAAGDRVMNALALGGGAALPHGLLRQPRGVRRRLDEGLPGRVPEAARLRPGALPARALPRRRGRHAARAPRRPPDALGAEPRLLLRSARGVGRSRAG